MIKKIISIIYESIDEINEFLDDNSKIKKNENTILFDSDNGLDSLSFFNLVLAIEKKISEDYSVKIILTDIDDLDNDNNPFKTVRSTAQYIVNKIK
tara:strand:+ start:333 stop:620 length:288 start_codon:yes stop_codon:yes gene_type:complete